MQTGLHQAARAQLRAETIAKANAAANAVKKQRRKKTFRPFRIALNIVGGAGALVAAFAVNLALNPDAVAQEPQAWMLLSAFTAPVINPQDPQALDTVPAQVAQVVEPDPTEVRLLAATAWAEARSEGEAGMRAVAHVIINRRAAERFGEDLEDVVWSPKQFSAWNRGDPNRPLALNPERYAQSGINKETWEEAQTVAREVLSGQSVDPTSGALFYHTAAIRPYWARYGHGRQQIGAHVFYATVGGPRHG